jgi:hypothetical protein
MDKVAVFVLQCIALLPVPLLAPLTGPLLLEPAAEALGSPAAVHAALLAAAGSWPQRSLLHLLGCQLGVAAWRRDWQQHCCAGTAARGGAGAGGEGAEGAEAMEVDGGEAAAAGAGGALDGLLQQLQQQQPREAAAGAEQQQQPPDAAPAAPTAPAAEAPAAAGSAAQQAPPAAGSELCGSRQAIVEAIRREEFGLGVQLDQAGGWGAPLRPCSSADGL